MNTKIKIKGTLLALLFIGLTLEAMAQPMCGRQRINQNYERPGTGKMMCENLPDLTDEQAAQLKTIRTEHLKQLAPMQSKVQILKAELRDLEIAENYDQKAVAEKLDALYEAKKKMAMQRFEHHNQVRGVLTDEQLAVFNMQGMRQGRGQYGYYGRGACRMRCMQ